MFLKIVKICPLFTKITRFCCPISSSANTVIKATTLTPLLFFLLAVSAKNALLMKAGRSVCVWGWWEGVEPCMVSTKTNKFGLFHLFYSYGFCGNCIQPLLKYMKAMQSSVQNSGSKSGSGSALEWKAGSGSSFKSKFRSFWGSKCSREGPWTLTVDAGRLKIEPWWDCRPVVAASHQFNWEQDPNPESGSTFKWKVGSGSALKWKDESGSALKWFGSIYTILYSYNSSLFT